MLNIFRTAALPGSLLLMLATHPSDALAQSIDDCMAAEHAEALTLCQNILDNGSRNADVYWKLSSALYQNGQQAKAGRTLVEALRLHPGNTKLLKLQDIISSATTEQEMLERAAELNQRSYDQGALKISCLTKSGVEGISACKRRLELTDDDGDNMRARLSELESQQKPEAVATSPDKELPEEIDDSSEPTSKPEKIIAATETNPDVSNDAETQAAEERKIAYKNLVTQVQATLNDLGFPTGTPDGFPGSKTRQALSDFYTVLDEPASKSITEFTLGQLNLQKSKLANANQLVKESEEALIQSDIDLAREKLAEAKAISQLLKVPEELERALRELPSNNLASTTVDVPVKTEPKFGELTELDSPIIVPSTNTEIGSEIGTEIGTEAGTEIVTSIKTDTEINVAPSDQFVDLMNKINTLHGKIKRVEEDQLRRLDQVRNVL